MYTVVYYRKAGVKLDRHTADARRNWQKALSRSILLNHTMRMNPGRENGRIVHSS